MICSFRCTRLRKLFNIFVQMQVSLRIIFQWWGSLELFFRSYLYLVCYLFGTSALILLILLLLKILILIWKLFCSFWRRWYRYSPANCSLFKEWTPFCWKWNLRPVTSYSSRALQYSSCKWSTRQSSSWRYVSWMIILLQFWLESG